MKELIDSDLDTDGTLAADSDVKIATQKATRTYADTKAAVSQPAYTAISSFDNSWANTGGTYEVAGYVIDTIGFVHLKGSIQSGTNGSSAFTLPSGYRPAAREIFGAFAYGTGYTNGTIIIYPTGEVICILETAGGSNQISLSGITFKGH